MPGDLIQKPASTKAPKSEQLSENTNRLMVIDGLRAWAATHVFVFHVWQFVGYPTAIVTFFGLKLDLYGFVATGYSGVDLFMILSGLCLFLPIVKSPVRLETFDTAAFLRRRMWRLMPGYYASMLYVVILPAILVSVFKFCHLKANWQPLPSVWQVVSHLFWIHTFFKDTIRGFAGPWWTLGVEAQLYLAFPLALLAYRKWGPKVFPGYIVLSIIYQLIVLHLNRNDGELANLWSVNLLGRWIEFGLGMGIAWLMVHQSRIRGVMDIVLKFSLPVGICAYFLAARNTSLTWFPTQLCCITVAYGLIVLNVCCGNGFSHKILKNRYFAFVGMISYSLYLVHQPTAWYFSEFCKKLLHTSDTTRFFLTSTIGFCVVLCVSWAFYRVFEKPFLAKSKGYDRAKSTL